MWWSNFAHFKSFDLPYGLVKRAKVIKIPHYTILLPKLLMRGTLTPMRWFLPRRALICSTTLGSSLNSCLSWFKYYLLNSFIDDIVLGYIVSVLEQIGDEQFDVEEFADIMALHIPGFDTLNR